MARVLVLLALLLLPVAGVSADIYRYTDENGVVCYTNAPLDRNGKEALIPEREESPRAVETQPAKGHDYVRHVNRAARKYDIEPDLIHAVIKTESNGNWRAVSRKGAMGLMQLMPATASEMNVLNPFNPAENIEGGTRYLKYLLDRFNGNLTLALAAYNSGPKTVEKYRNVPPITETRQYVNRVFSLYKGRRSYPVRDAEPEPEETQTRIYRVVLDDGTILFTNATLEKPGRMRF